MTTDGTTQHGAGAPGAPADSSDAAARGVGVGWPEVLATLIDTCPVAVCVTADDGTIEHVSSSWTVIFGHPADELVGQPFTVVVPPEDRTRLRQVHDRFIARGGALREDWQLVDRDRTRRTVRTDACRMVGPDGRYRKVTFVADVTEQRRWESALAQADTELAEANLRLAHLAAHDSLTGLPNHHRSHELLVQAIETAERYGRDLAVALLDLDRFKVINDTYGHMEGDQLIIEFARQLSAQLRAVDAAGRVGGEEFLLVLPETTRAGAQVVLDRLRTACWDHLRTPDGDAVQFSAGVVGFAAHDMPEMLLHRADAALARAKDRGRNRTELG